MIQSGRYLLLALLGAGLFIGVSAKAPPATVESLELDQVWRGKLSSGGDALWKTAALDPSRLYTLSVSVDAVPLRSGDSLGLSFEGAGLQLKKQLHAGDPSYFTTFRPRANTPAVLRLIPSFSQGLAPVARMELRRLEASLDEQAALEIGRAHV